MSIAPQCPAPAGEVVPRLGSHIPALDGIRGLAILLVLGIHFNPLSVVTNPWAKIYSYVVGYGVTGVDLFFVLSGFLITGILCDAKGGGHFFRNFYMRRMLRIFPLYYGALVVLFFVVPLISALNTPEAQYLAQHQLWYWSYCSNIHLAMQGDGYVRLFSHFWSLAVEEHFYLVWPLLVFLFPLGRLRWVCGVIIGVAIVSRVAAAAYLQSDIGPYVLTPCRADALAVGGLWAVVLRLPHSVSGLLGTARRQLLLSFVALLTMQGLLVILKHRSDALGWSFLVFHNALYHLLLSIFYGAILVLGTHPQSSGILPRMFCFRPLMFLGTYAYGLYIVHPAIADLLLWIDLQGCLRAVHIPLGVAVPLHQVIGMAVSLVLAMASYHLYEKRFLKLKDFFEYERAGRAGS